MHPEVERWQFLFICLGRLPTADLVLGESGEGRAFESSGEKLPDTEGLRERARCSVSALHVERLRTACDKENQTSAL